MAPKQQRNRRSRLATTLLPGSGKPSNPEQVVRSVWLQGPPTKLTSQSSTGLITAVITPSLNDLSNTNWRNIADEYRIKEIVFHAYPVGANSGVTAFILDDEDSTLPIIGDTKARRAKFLVNNSANQKSLSSFHYRCENIDDLKWISCKSAGSATPMALKVYTDLSTYITQPSTDLWVINYEALFEFRGIGNNS